jgi:hypothetical protein
MVSHDDIAAGSNLSLLSPRHSAIIITSPSFLCYLYTRKEVLVLLLVLVVVGRARQKGMCELAHIESLPASQGLLVESQMHWPLLYPATLLVLSSFTECIPCVCAKCVLGKSQGLLH